MVRVEGIEVLQHRPLSQRKILSVKSQVPPEREGELGK